METINSKTVFIEYSSARHGQHFMTVVQTMNHDRIIVGRIYRDYNQETKKTYYKAYDFNGEQIFGNGLDLSSLKDKFKKSGKFLADGVIANRRVQRQQVHKIPSELKAVRIQTMNEIRGKKIEKMGEKKEPPIKSDVKEQDGKTMTQQKDIGHIIESEIKTEQGSEKGEDIHEVDSIEKQSSDNQEEERNQELEEIRTDQGDRDQELEIEI